MKRELSGCKRKKKREIINLDHLFIISVIYAFQMTVAIVVFIAGIIDYRSKAKGNYGTKESNGCNLFIAPKCKFQLLLHNRLLFSQ